MLTILSKIVATEGCIVVLLMPLAREQTAGKRVIKKLRIKKTESKNRKSNVMYLELSFAS